MHILDVFSLNIYKSVVLTINEVLFGGGGVSGRLIITLNILMFWKTWLKYSWGKRYKAKILMKGFSSFQEFLNIPNTNIAMYRYICTYNVEMQAEMSEFFHLIYMLSLSVIIRFSEYMYIVLTVLVAFRKKL